MTRLRVRSAPKYAPRGPVLPPNEPEVDTFLSNVQAVSGSVSAGNLALLNTLISSMRANSTLGTIQRWYFPAGSDSFAGAMVPLIDTLSLGNFTNDGFTSSEWSTAGLKGSGSQYVGTGYIGGTHIANINSVNVTLELTEYATNFSYPMPFGADETSRKMLLLGSQFDDSGSEFYDNSTTTTYNGSPLAVGTIVVNRASSASHELLLNGSRLSLNSSTRVSVPPTSQQIYIHACNVNGAASNFSSSRILSLTIGSSQSSAQMATFAAAIAAYKTAKGI